MLLIVFPFDFRQALINTLIGVLMALSLVVVTGFVGQISLIQLALAGAAGFTISHMATNFGIVFPVAALAGIAVAVVIGLITAVSAVRVRGVIAFAYAGGITFISGAVFAGLLSAQALIPYALDDWFGLNGNWFLLAGGVLLIFTLLRNPEGVAGDFYRRTHKRPEIRAPDIAAAAVPAPSEPSAPIWPAVPPCCG